MRRWMVLSLLLLLPAAAFAAPLYTVTTNGAAISSPTPLVRNTSLDILTPMQHIVGQLSGTAMEGCAVAGGDVSGDALTYLGVSAYAEIDAASSTNDFIITGPPGATSVSATFKFTINCAIGLSGGSVNNNAHEGLIQVMAGVDAVSWLGQLHVGNYISYGAYGLTGVTGDHVNTVIGLAGTFPVGTPIGVSMGSNFVAYIYGNAATVPNRVTGEAFVAPNGPSIGIGDGTGVVMTLPPGYTVNSTTWHVVNNVYTPPASLAASPAPQSHELALAITSQNPAFGVTRLRFTLPAAGVAELTVFDASGRRMSTLASGWHEAGTHTAQWDGTDRFGQSAAPGVYFASLRFGSRMVTRRVVRIR